MTTILIATGIYPPESGGPATYSKLLEEHLPELGFDVRVLPFRTVRHLPKALRHAAYFFKCLAAARGADIVYALDTVSVGLPAMLAAKCMGKKFVVRVPGDYAWEQARQRFGVTDDLDAFQHEQYGSRTEALRRVQRRVVRAANAVVVPSEYMKKIVAKWGNPRVERIYSSINLSVEPQLPTNRPQGFLVVTIARPVPWKGLEGLARVVAREKSWHVKIVDGIPYSQALGWVKTADAFVLNSTYEGLSHALIEAMALGTPIVATRVGGNPELIESGKEGVLIEAGNDDELYAALKYIEEKPEEAKARAAAARAKTKEFDINTTIGQIAKLLKTI